MLKLCRIRVFQNSGDFGLNVTSMTLKNCPPSNQSIASPLTHQWITLSTSWHILSRLYLPTCHRFLSTSPLSKIFEIPHCRQECCIIIVYGTLDGMCLSVVSSDWVQILFAMNNRVTITFYYKAFLTVSAVIFTIIYKNPIHSCSYATCISNTCGIQ